MISAVDIALSMMHAYLCIYPKSYVLITTHSCEMSSKLLVKQVIQLSSFLWHLATINMQP